MQILNLSSLISPISDLKEIRFAARDLEKLSRDDPDQRLETDAYGQLIIMSPTGSETSDRNSELIFQVKLWNKSSKLGKVFDSSGGFRLSNGAVRSRLCRGTEWSPDVSWITIAKWNALTKEQKRKFAPVDPDFVIELKSPSDDLQTLQQKMLEYMSCGVRLGWLIDPDTKQVEIYRQNQTNEILNNPATLTGENIMPGLTVDLTEIWT